MPVFKIQKYAPKEQENANSGVQNENTESKQEEKEPVKEITVRADKTIAEIVAAALNSALANKAEIQEIDESKANNIDIDVVSTETIDKDPIKTLKATSKSKNIYYYSSESKIPPTVSWFIMNSKNNGKNFMYSTEALCRYITAELEV